MGFVFLAAFIVFASVILLMSLGFIFKRKCLRGSCGSEGAIGPDGEIIRCDGCPNHPAKG